MKTCETKICDVIWFQLKKIFYEKDNDKKQKMLNDYQQKLRKSTMIESDSNSVYTFH